MTEQDAAKFLAMVKFILDQNRVEPEAAREFLEKAKKVATAARNMAHARALMDRVFPWGANEEWFQGIDDRIFSGSLGAKYRDKYLLPFTLFVHEFNAPDRKKEDKETRIFVPYTGNEHNRREFPHLLLSIVAEHEFKLTGSLPDYFEPCVGSGQIYMNSDPTKFANITLGDINPFVLSVYLSVQREGPNFIEAYAKNAEHWDKSVKENFDHKMGWLSAIQPFDEGVQKILDDTVLCSVLAQHYLWLMNRSQLMPTLRKKGGVLAGLEPSHADQAEDQAEDRQLREGRLREVRFREGRALDWLRKRLVTGTVAPSPKSPKICRSDLKDTMALAERCSSALVMIDAPFPKFMYVEGYDALHCYGTDDGEDLQNRILQGTKRLYELGRPVIICNYATPSLILAYQEAGAYPIFSFCSPKARTYIYMLAVFYKGQGTEILYKVQEKWFR